MHFSVGTTMATALAFLASALPQKASVGNVAITYQIVDTFGCPVQEDATGHVLVLPCTGTIVEKRHLPDDFIIYPDGTGSYLGRSLTSDLVTRVVDQASAHSNIRLDKRQNWIAGLICIGDLYDCEQGCTNPTLPTPPLLCLAGDEPTPLQCTEWICSANGGWCAQNYAPIGQDCALGQAFIPKRNFINAGSIPELQVFSDGSGEYRNLTLSKAMVGQMLDVQANNVAAGPMASMQKRSCDDVWPEWICRSYLNVCVQEQIERSLYACDLWACNQNNGWCNTNDADPGCFCAPAPCTICD